ncbi:MAG: hypothetical protein AAGC88_15630 [Bacteroidota bacterium]
MKPYSILCIVLLIGCSAPQEKATQEEESVATAVEPSSENQMQESETESSNDIQEEEEYDEETPGFNYGAFDAITIRSAALFDSPDLGLTSIGNIPASVFVNIAEKGDRQAMAGDDECLGAGYHWFAVSEGGDAPSWVYGADIYLRQQEEEYFNNNMSPEVDDFGYKIGDSFYRFDLAVSTFEEPDDLDEPIECGTYGMPFLYIETEPDVYPIIVPDELQSDLRYGLEVSSEGVLLLVIASGYFSSRIIDFNENGEGQFEIDIIIDKMDGVEQVELALKEVDGEFVMTGLKTR